jgi:hypothetical protein
MLRFREGYLVYKFVAPDAALSARFLSDPVANPERVPALEYALRRFDEAGRMPRHPAVVDQIAFRAALALGRTADARRILDHILAAHPYADPEFVAGAKADVEAAERR